MDLRTKPEVGHQQKGKRYSQKLFGPFCVLSSSFGRSSVFFLKFYQISDMANFLVPLLFTLYKDQEALRGKLTTICPSSGSSSRSASWLGTGDSKSGAFLTARSCIAPQKSSLTTDPRHTTSSWNANTEDLGQQQKVKSLTGFLLHLLLFLGPMENDLFLPAFL